jgi:hypothetical protein
MAITIASEAWNHRCVYYEYTGDGVVTQSSVSLRKFVKPGTTASATGVATPLTVSHQSGKGGLIFPSGTAIAIASCVIANGVVTVTTSAAVANGTKACIVVVLDQPGD